MKKSSALITIAVVGTSLALGFLMLTGNNNLLQAQLLQPILEPVLSPVTTPLAPTVNTVLEPVDALTGPALETLEDALGNIDTLELGETIEILLVNIEDAGLPLDQLIPIEVDAPVFLGEENTVDPHIRLFIEEEQPVDVAVNYLISGSTATPGEDFTPTLGTAVIKAGETEVDIPLNILNDTIEEPVETLLVSLFNPVNAILGEENALELNIQDDDFVGLSITPTCLNINEGQGTYEITLAGQPVNPVEILLDSTNNVNIDVSSITIAPSEWDTPQTVTVEAVEGTIFDLIHTGNVFLLSDSLDTNFAGEEVLPLDIFFSDQGERSSSGLLNIDGCQSSIVNPPTCDPGQEECPPPTCDPKKEKCGGVSPPRTTGGGGGGEGGGTKPLGYCLEFVKDRNLTFLDLNEAFPNEIAYLEILKRSRESQFGQFVLSGYANPEELTTADLNNANESLVSYIGPRNNVLRLELTKVLLISHCYPILDATTLDETNDGRPMANWSDLPREHNGDKIHDEVVDIAYSGMYWGIWEGYRDNTIRVGNEVSTAEAIKMFVRIGELVKYAEPHTVDDPSDQWWKNFYENAKAEGTAVYLRSIMRVQDPVQRGEGAVELLKGMIIREMYKAEDRFNVLEFLMDNTTGDPYADERKAELDLPTVFKDDILILNRELELEIPTEGDAMETLKKSVLTIVPSYLSTRERTKISESLAENVLSMRGAEPGSKFKLFPDGTILPLSEAKSLQEQSEESEAEESQKTDSTETRPSWKPAPATYNF